MRQLVSHTAETEGQERATGYPRSMMIAKLGDEPQLLAALHSGEVRCVTDRGRQFFMFNTISISKKTIAKSTVEAETGNEASPEAFGSLAGFVEGFNPTFSAVVTFRISVLEDYGVFVFVHILCQIIRVLFFCSRGFFSEVELPHLVL